MKIKKILLSILIMSFIFVMSSCNNINTIENRFEKAGYDIEKIEDVNEYLEFEEDSDVLEIIDGFYVLYDNYRKEIAYIYDFKSKSDLEDLLAEEGFTVEDFGDYVYKNIFLVTLVTDDQDIINAFQGR